jgi:hypothetical protein
LDFSIPEWRQVLSNEAKRKTYTNKRPAEQPRHRELPPPASQPSGKDEGLGRSDQRKVKRPRGVGGSKQQCLRRRLQDLIWIKGAK